MSLLNKASIVTTPTSYENGKILSVKPSIVLGEELVTNGNFSNGANNWLLGTGWTIGDNKAERLVATSSTDLVQASVFPNLTSTFRISFDIEATAGSVRARLGQTNLNYVGQGTYTFYAIPSANDQLKFQADSSFIGSITNISVKEAIDADFQFTRNSSATRTNSQGLIEDMQILSGDLVSNGDFSQEGSQLILNPNFNDDTWWVVESPAVEISNGKANFNTILQNWGIYKNNTLTSGKQYKVLFTIDSYTSGGVYLNIGGVVIGSYTAIGTYTTYVTGGGTNVFGIQSNSGGAILSIDNVSVKEVGQDWEFNSTAILTANGMNITTGGFIRQDVVTIGKSYKLTYDIFSYTSGDIRLYDGTNQGNLPTSIGSNTFNFIAGGSNLVIQSNSVNVNLVITNISVIEITSDTNLPRIDYTGGVGHWLFEGQSTNLITQSEAFDNSYWTKGGSSVVSGFTSPSGGLNAFKLVEDTSTSDHILFKNIAAADGLSHTFSVLVKPAGRTSIQIYNGDLDEQSSFFNLTTKTIINGSSVVSSNIRELTDGWFKCSVTTTNSKKKIYIKLYNGTTTYYTGDGTSGVYVYGAQLEQSSFATSYIPTEGSIKTRLADAAFGAGSSDLINSTEGVLYAEIAALADDGTARTISINNTVSNRVFLQLRSATGQVNSGIVVGGALQGNAMSYSISQTSNIKLAIKYKLNDFALWVNGVEVGTSTGNVFTSGALNDLSFDSGDGAEKFFGKTKCVAVFKEALNNDELECLTGEGYDSFNALALANNYTII